MTDLPPPPPPPRRRQDRRRAPDSADYVGDAGSPLPPVSTPPTPPPPAAPVPPPPSFAPSTPIASEGGDEEEEFLVPDPSVAAEYGVEIHAPESAIPEEPEDYSTGAFLGAGNSANPTSVVYPPDIQAAAQALLDFIGDDECSEVLLNGPNECSRKIRGARYHCPEVMFGDKEIYHDVLNRIILGYCDAHDRIDGKTVLIEGQMELQSPSGRAPMIARVHIIAPPGVNHAKVTIAKKPRTDLTVDDMIQTGTMTREMGEFLKAVARGRATFAVSGPTGAGKSTLLQAMSHYFDQNDRVVVIEETPELRLPLGDVVYLKATMERPGMESRDVYTLEFWTKQANRMRMDRVIVGETRGAEMSEWLIAANSGAEGSATTIHADSPRRCLSKMLALASKAPGSTSEAQLQREIAATVDIIVQISLIDGRHVVTGIEEVVNTVTQQTGQILSNPLFTYDRGRGVHVVKGRPSDEFIARLANRGVPLNAAWFRNPR
jgi:Flp pilus assembly CpaF family ATPase